LFGKQYARSDHAYYGSHADLQTARSLINADRCRAGCVGIEGWNSESFAQSTNPKCSPGLAIVSLASHAIHGHSELPVRPVRSERSDHFYRTRMSIVGVSAGSGPRQADLGMPPSGPVDRHSDFVFVIVQIYDDFLYQNPGQPLLRSHGCAGRIPGRRQIVRECQ
jgi:hypothetical protein